MKPSDDAEKRQTYECDSLPMKTTDRTNVLLVVLLGIFLYANSIPGDYVMDDVVRVRDNPYIESFGDFFSYFTSDTGTPGKRPILTASYLADTLIFGKSKAAYHVSNIVYYLIYCSLVYVMCLRLFSDRFLSLAIALIFTAHPVHTEGVAYISGREDLFGGIFAVSSVIFFLSYRTRGKRASAVFAVVSFLLTVGVKEIYIVSPLLFLLIDWYSGESIKSKKEFYLALLLSVLIVAAYAVLWKGLYLPDYFRTMSLYDGGEGMNVPTALKVCTRILRLAVLPTGLSADYSFNSIERVDYFSYRFFVSVFVVLHLLFIAYVVRKKNRVTSFGLLWMYVCLVPLAQIVPDPEIITERSVILLSFGFCVTLGAVVVRLPRIWGISALSVVVIGFSAMTVTRNFDWRNEATIWGAATKTHPSCARARYRYGHAIKKTGRPEEAKREFSASLAVNPLERIIPPDHSEDAVIELGTIYDTLGEPDNAEAPTGSVIERGGGR